jgi:hypothetical protein
MISLILSLILWLYVTGELERGLWWKTKELTFYEIPIKVMGLPEKEFSLDIKPDKANVVLYSYKRNIENITRDDILLFVDLSNLMPVTYELSPTTYELSVKNMIPKDFNVSKIEPSRVIVTIQKESVNSLGSEVQPFSEKAEQK